MKETILKTAGFIIIFIVSAFIISNMMNRGNTDMTAEMAEATYPTADIMINSGKVNLMHAYSGTISAEYLRGALSPLNNDRSIKVEISEYDTNITGLLYEVRSMDTTRLVESTEVYDYTEKNGIIYATLNIKDLIDKNTEYMLDIIAKDDMGNEYKFYTRIIEDDAFHTDDMVSFVNDFSEKTFNKDRAKELTTYLESNETGDNTSFADVNIHSSFAQITWGNLAPEITGNAVTTILEMNENTACIKRDYTVSAGADTDRQEYTVTEYYRIRYTQQRIYLLDYERTMNQIFKPESASFANDKILLGITDFNVNMMENGDGNVVAFVSDGTLYAYRVSDERIARLFTFRDSNHTDERDKFNDYAIKILSVDEGGNVRFLVYGYMNRGRHEGKVGASVFYYDSTLNTVEEEIYIPYSRSYPMLKKNIELLAYSGEGSNFYIYMDGTIYRIHLEDQSYDKIAEGIDYDSIVVSNSGRMAAWQKSSGDSTITLEDFHSGKSREIKADTGNKNRLIGFIGEDFAFGEANTKNMIRTATGTTMLPMHTIFIEDKDGKILKKYAEDGIYVTDVTIDGNTMNLTRISMSENAAAFAAIKNDQIMSSEPETTMKNKLVSVSTEDRENIMEIALTDIVKQSSLQLLTPKEVLFEGGREADLEQSVTQNDNNKDNYYVYAKGYIEGIYKEVYEAVNKAEESSGIVVDGAGAYIWRIGSRDVEHDISDVKALKTDGTDRTSLSVCLDEILNHEGVSVNTKQYLDQGETAVRILSDNIDARVFDMGGCSLDDMLYYVNLNTPVIATGDNGSVLIVGYDTKNIKIMDPSTGTIYKVGLNDAKAMFSSHGNEFVAYIKN